MHYEVRANVSGHRSGQVTRVCPGMWQIPQVRGFLAAGGLLAPPAGRRSPLPSLPLLNPPPEPLVGRTFSSAHWKKLHCCSLVLPQAWNTRPLLGPSFCTVRATASTLHLHITCPDPRSSCLLPPSDVFLNPRLGLGGWETLWGQADTLWLGELAWSAHRKKLQLPALHLKNWRPWFGPSLRTVRRSASCPQLHTITSPSGSALMPPSPPLGGGLCSEPQEGAGGRQGSGLELGALGGRGGGG